MYKFQWFFQNFHHRMMPFFNTKVDSFRLHFVVLILWSWYVFTIFVYLKQYLAWLSWEKLTCASWVWKDFSCACCSWRFLLEKRIYFWACVTWDLFTCAWTINLLEHLLLETLFTCAWPENLLEIFYLCMNNASGLLIFSDLTSHMKCFNAYLGHVDLCLQVLHRMPFLLSLVQHGFFGCRSGRKTRINEWVCQGQAKSSNSTHCRSFHHSDILGWHFCWPTSGTKAQSAWALWLHLLLAGHCNLGGIVLQLQVGLWSALVCSTSCCQWQKIANWLRPSCAQLWRLFTRTKTWTWWWPKRKVQRIASTSWILPFESWWICCAT